MVPAISNAAEEQSRRVGRHRQDGIRAREVGDPRAV